MIEYMKKRKLRSVKRNFFLGKMREFGPNLSQNYATFSPMISFKDLFKMLQDDRAQWVGKIHISQLSKKNDLSGQMGNLEPH